MSVIGKAEAILSLLPDSQVLVDVEDNVTWIVPPTPALTDEQISAEQARLEALLPLNICKQQASALLYATDWTTIPDVANPANNPYLTNQSEFIAYRNEVRKLAVNPVINPVFPNTPTAQWSN